MLPISLDHVRLFVHVLAAAVWVGGQLALVGLVRPARAIADDAPRALARSFARIAWPAYALVVATGVWNLTEIHIGSRSTEYLVSLFVKLGMVALSGVGAALHALARSRVALAVWGAVGLLSGMGALLVGVVLRG